MILAALACPVFTSCYDDSALNGRLDKVEQDVQTLSEKLAALESKLNLELTALQTLLEGKIAALQGQVDALVTVSSCTAQKNGAYEITLSDGSKFTVYPEYEQDLKGLVTTTKIADVLYWAVYDEDGKPVVVTDANGNPVPVVDVTPQVRVDQETGLVEISFDGGIEWTAVGYDTPCVFAGAEVVYTDNYTDEQEAEDPYYYQEVPMYVTLTLADGSTITVTIDGAASFMFASNYGGIIKNQYISAGSTTTIPVAATNISDWVKEVPTGWTVVEDTKYLADYGQAEFHVTAPSAEAIASGAAVAEGNLKVLAVAEGGKSITASVKVTTSPFSGVTASNGSFTVKMNSGLGGYLVGVSPVDEFDADAIVAELKPYIEAVEESWGALMPSWSPWYVDETPTTLDDNYFDSSVEEYPIANLSLAEELVEGQVYILWAVGIDMYPLGGWYDGYRVGAVATTQYLNGGIELDESKTVVSFNDIQITVNFKGVDTFYGYFAEASYGAPTIQDIVDQVNGEYVAYEEYHEVIWENGVYEGDPNSLVNGYYTIEPGSDYYLWLVPRIEGKKVYTEADVYFYEWSTDPLQAGSSIQVVAGEAVTDYKKITVPLTAEEAVYIFYSFVNPEAVSTIADKQEYLLTKGTMREGASTSAYIANLTPATAKTLIAMAVDQEGKYGEVFQQEYTTKPMEYAAATVVAELQGVPAQTGLVKLSCDAEVDTYYWWCGSANAYQWTDSYYFGGTVESASAFIALTPNSYLLKKVTAAALPEDGVQITGLTVGEPAIFLVAAKLTDGTYTKATVLNFTPEMSLGNIVYATDDNGNENAAWVAAKPVVNFSVSTIGDFSDVAWTVELPEGYTGVTACFHPDYLTDYPSVKSKIQYILTNEYIYSNVIEDGETYVNAYATNGYNIYTVICDADGNYYEPYVTELNITGGFGQ